MHRRHHTAKPESDPSSRESGALLALLLVAQAYSRDEVYGGLPGGCGLAISAGGSGDSSGERLQQRQVS